MGGTREWCLVKPTLASPIFFLRWVNTDEHEFYSEHFSQEFPYLSAIRGTRPPPLREVNSRGSSPAVGRSHASPGLLRWHPLNIISEIAFSSSEDTKPGFLGNSLAEGTLRPLMAGLLTGTYRLFLHTSFTFPYKLSLQQVSATFLE